MIETGIGWLLIVLGWLVIYHFSERRDFRNDIKDVVVKISELVKAIEENAIKYHEASAHSKRLAASIKADLQALSRYCNLLRSICRENELDDRMIDFRRAITYKNFDTASHAPWDIQSEEIRQIRQSGDELITFIEEIYWALHTRLIKVVSAFQVRRGMSK